MRTAFLQDHVRAGKVQLLLNAADHDHMRLAFLYIVAIYIATIYICSYINNMWITLLQDHVRAGKMLKQTDR